MNSFLFLVCCLAIMGAPLCGADPSADDDGTADDGAASAAYPTTPTASPNIVFRNIDARTLLNTPATTSKSRSTSPSPGPKPNHIPDVLFFEMEPLQVFFVTGGLIILCFTQLLCILFLAVKVCRQHRRIKSLSSSADLIGTSEYRMDTKKDKSKSETEPVETTVLMSDLSQTKQEEMGNGTTKEEGDKVDKDEEKKKEEGDESKSEETLPASAESSISSKPQEEANDSKTPEASAASSSGDTEESIEVV
uniref:uncharacterized protein n=1 Tax=Semicossyphus pulcher TaxID=241346 RepID=UPI0037E8BE42